MTRFYPVYVRRSDGKVEIEPKSKRRERNEPTEEQLDQKPDSNGVSDFYREVTPDEPKHLDWRRKLGGMLAREMNWKDKNGQHGHEGGYILVTFPGNYRLFEHVKKTEKDGHAKVKHKTHAAGGNDRQDAYLYGHPVGRKKRYRSPADFFPHLLWLCTDELGDPDNCSCKICQPEEYDGSASVVKGKSERGAKREMDTKPPTPAITSTVTQGSAQGAKVKQELNGPVPVPHQAAHPQRQLVPTPLPPAKPGDQTTDRQYHTFMYRSGEIVWFRRGQAWGLGAITRRWLTHSNDHHYNVQPLSNPFRHPETVVKSSHHELRPWLAWSVPRYTNDILNNLPSPPTYETADWQGILQKRYGVGDMEVDGSILAAKMIDSSYTPVNPNKSTEPEVGVIETHYDGIFIGAEKIWVGDPARLLIGTGTDILVVHDIVEQKRSSAMYLSPQIHLLGDIYTLQRVAHADANIPTPASKDSNPQLPHRLTEDLMFRNARSIQAKGLASYWKLASAQARIGLDDIKGRWYEASLILPILMTEEKWTETLRDGNIQEASLWMNSRGDCINANRDLQAPKLDQRQNVRRATRRDALSTAVPPTTKILDGISPPSLEGADPAFQNVAGDNTVGQSSRMDIDPRFETADDHGNDTRVVHPHHVAGSDGGDIDDFMDFDGMEDMSQGPSQSMPHYGQNYRNQGGHIPGQENYF